MSNLVSRINEVPQRTPEVRGRRQRAVSKAIRSGAMKVVAGLGGLYTLVAASTKDYTLVKFTATVSFLAALVLAAGVSCSNKKIPRNSS